MGCGSGSTCWRRLVRWQRAGVWKRLHAVLLTELRRRGQTRSGARRRRQRLAPRAARGKKTGPNPTDRRKAGSKHHVLTDAHGIPLVARLTAANRHDVTQLLPLVDAMPPLARTRRAAGAQAAARPRRPRLRFAAASRPTLARAASPRNSPSAADRTAAAWAARAGSSSARSPGCIDFADLAVRYERRPCIHEAFLTLACSLVCWYYLQAGHLISQRALSNPARKFAGPTGALNASRPAKPFQRVNAETICCQCYPTESDRPLSPGGRYTAY